MIKIVPAWAPLDLLEQQDVKHEAGKAVEVEDGLARLLVTEGQAQFADGSPATVALPAAKATKESK
jgi:hypothetical protein